MEPWMNGSRVLMRVTGARDRCCEDSMRVSCLQPGREPHQAPGMLAPDLRFSQNCEKEMSMLYKPVVYGTLLLQPNLTTA